MTRKDAPRAFTRYGAGTRAAWRASYAVANGRAKGSLYDGARLVRPSFNVAIKDGSFSVDIGTGSGVKIKFSHR